MAYIELTKLAHEAVEERVHAYTQDKLPVPSAKELYQDMMKTGKQWHSACIKAASYHLGHYSNVTSKQTKLDKATKFGWVNMGTTFSPHDEAAGWLSKPKTLCPWSYDGCRVPCIGLQGYAQMNGHQLARVAKTVALAYSPDTFINSAAQEIAQASKHAGYKGKLVAARPNISSDMLWYANELARRARTGTDYPIAFYDYTKSDDLTKLGRALWVTRAHSHHNMEKTEHILRHGLPVAIAFDLHGAEMPSRWRGYPVINADDFDIWPLRGEDHLDHDEPFIVGLRLRGSKRQLAIARQHGFAVSLP